MQILIKALRCQIDAQSICIKDACPYYTLRELSVPFLKGRVIHKDGKCYMEGCNSEKATQDAIDFLVNHMEDDLK